MGPLTITAIVFGSIFTLELGTIIAILLLKLKKPEQFKFTPNIYVNPGVDTPIADISSDTVIEMEHVSPEIYIKDVDFSTVASEETTIETSNNVNKLKELKK